MRVAARNNDILAYAGVVFRRARHLFADGRARAWAL